MARSQNSFIKKLKAEKKRKKKIEKFERKLERKSESTSGQLKDMLAYVDDEGNIVSGKEEEQEVKKEEKKDEKKDGPARK
jgi:hypothetical protein